MTQLYPKDVLTDLFDSFEWDMAEGDCERMARLVIQQLTDAGFTILGTMRSGAGSGECSSVPNGERG